MFIRNEVLCKIRYTFALLKYSVGLYIIRYDHFRFVKCSPIRSPNGLKCVQP